MLDTNIVLDCFVFTEPSAAPIVQLLHTGRAVALTRGDCLHELDRVLDYPRFGLSDDAKAQIAARYRAFAVDVAAPGIDASAPAPARLPLCRDPDDQKFLEVARDGQAAYLVSKDKQVLSLARRRSPPLAFRIVSLAAFQPQALAALR